MTAGASHRGMFITFEGIEGVGKSTQARFAAQYLRSIDMPVLETREPGGTVIGEKLRAVLLDSTLTTVDNETELMLMFAARNQHLCEIIRPALNRGTWVLCDRFTDASFAYQGGGRGLDERRIEVLEAFVHADLQPDRTFLFTAPVDLALRRASRRSAADRFERETGAFFNRVHMAYLRRAEQFPTRFTCIDAAECPDRIADEVRQHLRKMVASVV